MLREFGIELVSIANFACSVFWFTQHQDQDAWLISCLRWGVTSRWAGDNARCARQSHGSRSRFLISAPGMVETQGAGMTATPSRGRFSGLSMAPVPLPRNLPEKLRIDA